MNIYIYIYIYTHACIHAEGRDTLYECGPARRPMVRTRLPKPAVRNTCSILGSLVSVPPASSLISVRSALFWKGGDVTQFSLMLDPTSENLDPPPRPTRLPPHLPTPPHPTPPDPVACTTCPLICPSVCPLMCPPACLLVCPLIRCAP
jgi:hypothetical protein